jgi:hypothetical protein
MAKYKLLADSYIPRAPNLQPERLKKGTEIEFDGVPGSNLHLISGKRAEEIEGLRRKAKSLRIKFDDKTTADDLREAIKRKAATAIT